MSIESGPSSEDIGQARIGAYTEKWEDKDIKAWEASELEQRERMERRLGDCRVEAEKKKLGWVTGEWLTVDETMTPASNVGFYSNQRNGILAFVDGEGRMRVAPDSPNRFDALDKAGYKSGDMWIPFSMDILSVPLDPTLREQWEKMQEERRKERGL